MSASLIYQSMRSALAAHTGQAVTIVSTQSYDWLPSVVRAGWVRLLGKLDRAVRLAAQESTTGKVTLVAHSSGGVLARLYLSPETFLGRAYRGLQYIDWLITLGSPHHNQGGLMHGGWMSRWVERKYPGAFFAPDVAYSSVVGRSVRGSARGTRQGRWAYHVYRAIGGEGAAWGDGLIPVEAGLLQGSRHVILEGVGHFPVVGKRWYGSAVVIPLWWQTPRDDHLPQ